MVYLVSVVAPIWRVLTGSKLLRTETEIKETHALVTKLVRIIVEGGTLTGTRRCRIGLARS